MQVFKYYFKLAKSMKGSVLMYVGTFVFAAVAMNAQMPAGTTSFTAQKPNVAIVNHDGGEFSNGYVDYMKSVANIVSLKDSPDAHKEAIYFQSVDAVFVIPNNFSVDFFAGKKPQIEFTRSTGSQAEQAHSLTSNYLRLAEPRVLANMSQAETVDGIKGDVTKQVTVETESKTNVTEVGRAAFFMNIQIYVILALNLMAITTIMILFSGRMIKRRNQVSAMSYGRIAAQLLAANAVFSIAIWVIFLITAYFVYPSVMTSMYGVLFGLSSLMFSFVALAIAFMAGSLVTNRRAVPGITNVVALGMSFLCGVFVQQQFLGESVVNASKFLPAYWFVDANTLISKLTNFSTASLQPILVDWLVMLIFVVTIFAVTIMVGRVRRSDA